MENFEYIDDYFKGKKLPEETRQFEEQVVSDSSFAEDVAFYISTHNLLHEKLEDDKKKSFRQLYNQNIIPEKKSFVFRMMPYIAAAACVVIALAIWLLLSGNPAPQAMAEKYVKQNLQTLSVQMSSKPDSMQMAIQLYNHQQYHEALQIFEALSSHNANDFTAKKYAGIVSLKLKQYDKALMYFSSLEELQGLYTNPGKFYHALTLMSRGKKDDIAMAKKLLQEVISLNLEGKETAEEWIKQL